MAAVTWRDALLRYRAPRDMHTRARRAPFSVKAMGNALIATPASGSPRRITQAQFERTLPLLDRADRASMLDVSFNSSYIEAIVDDLRRP